EDALQLRRDVLALTREHLGVQNEFTLLCMNNLGSVYSFHQRHQEALEILEEAIELNQKYLPPDNHVALETIMSKAQCYMLMKETEKALELYLKVLDTRIKYLGINHPDTLFNILDVAEAEMTLGQYRTAYQRLQTALTHFEQTMGHHHSQTLQSLFMMISCLQALQQNKEALPWMRIYLFRFKGRKPENLARVYSLWCQHHEEQQDILSLEQTLQSWHDRNLETSYPMLLKQARYWALLSQSKKKVSGETGKPELKKAVKLLQAARLKGWLDFSLLKNDPVLVELLHREEFREMIQQTRVPARYWHL
ncbi:MAG TPA: tetratricopeptide repeat protein, partial [Gemmatales bacterium]|nr:tetratricopeptide repeat protein [Gemmatales bacterium]